jgi:putative transposase
MSALLVCAGAWVKYISRSKVSENIFTELLIGIKTTDFPLTAKRDKAAAMRFFDEAMQTNGIPETAATDKNGSSKVAIDEINDTMEIPMITRQVKYLNNIVEQDCRAVNGIRKSMIVLKLFNVAKNVLFWH